MPATDGSKANPSSSVASGIAFALAAFALFTGMDTVVKLLSERWHTFQVLFFNAAFAMIPMSVLVARQGVAKLRTREPQLHALRGLLSILGVSLTFYAYSRIPLADAYAILFAMPLIITALSMPLLREPVGWRRWCAVLVGFAGVLVMLRPGPGMMEAAAIAALLGAMMNALSVLLMRRMQATESSAAFGVYGNLASIVGAVFVLPFVWVTPTGTELLTSAVGGAVAGTAFLLLIAAYRRAPAAVIAPFQYSQMPYGLIVGYLLFGTVPEPMMLVGAVVVIGSGLYILHRETVLRRGLASATVVRVPMWRRWGGRPVR
jgi:drug/metabolite transporter (DMT)-like permease